MNMYDKLNEKQLMAVKHTEGYLRVIAGAGSGKTRVLVSRYSYLVSTLGIDPSNILCVTFTNKAAGEMKKRISAILGPAFQTSLICTYHGFCSRLLREDSEKLFLSKGFQIIDSYQQRTLLEEIFAKHELKLDYASFQMILKKIAQKKQDLSYVNGMIKSNKVQILSSIENFDDVIIEEYIQRQKAIYSLDFTDLLCFALFLLRNDEKIRDKWQNRLEYIMVDEFQDSSVTEMELINILSDKYKNLMIVGDPDQNIYEWRGSDVKLLVDFDKTHKITNTIILEENYRSIPQILNCANTLIELNELRLKKNLFTNNPAGANVIYYHSKTEDEEIKTIIKEIKNIKKSESRSYSDFAILYRSSFLSRVIERKFVENNIPYEIFGNVKFYQRMEIQDVVAYLKIIAFEDDLSLKRVINTPRRKFGRVRFAALKSIFEKGGYKNLYQTLKANTENKAFTGSETISFISTIEKMKQLKKQLKISELINSVCIETGYEQYIRELGDEERLDNLSEFKRIANEFEKGFGEEINLEGFLQQVALMSSEDNDKPCEAVKMMTIHASKGLEFPVVFIVGLTEGIFPSSRTIEERKQLGLEEERRLCYVAITRGQRRLFLMESEGVNMGGSKKLPSRFLSEIGPENYDQIGVISDDLKFDSRQFISKQNNKLVDDIKLDCGDFINHPVFGRGKILTRDERKNICCIKFDSMELPRNISVEFLTSRNR